MAAIPTHLEILMGLIITGCNAKGSAFEAIKASKKQNFVQALQKLQESDQFLSQAQQTQSQMLTETVAKKQSTVTFLMIHAQDHLMNARTFRDLAGELVDVYQQLLDH